MIETCVCGGQAVRVGSVPPHVEGERREAVHGSAVAARRKLKELFPLGISHLLNDDLPQPIHYLAFLRVAVHVTRIGLQLLEI